MLIARMSKVKVAGRSRYDARISSTHNRRHK